MKRIVELFLESRLQEETNNIPSFWYRGAEESPRLSIQTRSNFARYEGAKVDPLKREVPQVVENLYNAGNIPIIEWPSASSNWKIRRAYNGMQNFGNGVYFADNLEYAKYYGSNITLVKVSPEYVLKINWSDREVEGTPANKLFRYLQDKAGSDMATQAKMFYRAVKHVDKTKKALYIVDGSDEGQLVVYDPSIIMTIANFDMEENNE